MTTPHPRPPARVRAWAWSGALGVLLVLTSLAVASVSVWLVLPYLALMASIVFAPSGRRERRGDGGGESEAGSGPGVEGADDRPGAGVEDGAEGRASDDPATVTELAVEPADGPAADPGSRVVETRRGPGRGREAKAVDESAGATAAWIKIGQGQFARAESPGPPVVAPSPHFEGEPPGVLPPSPGTVGESADAPLSPDRVAGPEAAGAAEATIASEGEPEAQAVPDGDETVSDGPAPMRGEGDLGRVPEPDVSAGSSPAVDAAITSHRDVPPSVGEPTLFDVPPTGVGASFTAAFSPGDEAEAVPTADGSSAPGEGSESEDEAAPDGPTADGPATAWAGGDPGFAWSPGFAAESSWAAPPGSDPDVPPSADDGSGAGWREIAAGSAHDLRDQALEDVAVALVAEAIPAAALEMDATSEIGPGGEDARDNGIAPDAFNSGEDARDNGIAPDAFSLTPSAEPGDASNQDRDEVVDAPIPPVERPNRPTVGNRLASAFRGLRPRSGPANPSRLDRAPTSPGRGVRSGRRTRVTPGLRRSSRRRRGRVRPACRTFPPRSPPALADRS